MNEAFLLTGSNMDDRVACLARARKLIEQRAGSAIKASAIYETAAWGKTDQPSFLNQVILIKSLLEPQQLLKEVLAIEQEIGRVRGEKYGPRKIDIDILFYNNLEIHEPYLKIPHPHLQDRRFVLTPLAEIAPDHMHPILHKTIKELLEICTDPLPVKKYS